MWGNNTAGGMDLNTGTFVAKQGGPYIFTVTGLGYYGSSASYFEILHNGNLVASALDNTSRQSMLSQTVILNLHPMDKVRVKLLQKGFHSNNNNYILFVGHSL